MSKSYQLGENEMAAAKEHEKKLAAALKKKRAKIAA
jgi:hypothetical protein